MNKFDKSAQTGFTLGLCSMMAWLLPLIGYPISICGIVFSSIGLSSNELKGKAKTGLILSIIFLIITLCNSIAGVLMFFNT